MRFDYIIAGAPARRRTTDRQRERLRIPVRLEMTGLWLNRAGYSFSFDVNTPEQSSQLVAFVALLPPSGRLPASPAEDEDDAFTSHYSMLYSIYRLIARLSSALCDHHSPALLSSLVSPVKTPSCTPYDRLQSGPPSRRFPSQNPRRVIRGRKKTFISLSVRQRQSGRWMEHAEARGNDGVSQRSPVSSFSVLSPQSSHRARRTRPHRVTFQKPRRTPGVASPSLIGPFCSSVAFFFSFSRFATAS